MSGRYVLLVDDDIQFATPVADRLVRDGFELALARRRVEAVASVDRRWPDPARPRFLHTVPDGGYRLGDQAPDDRVPQGTPDGPGGHP